MKGVNKREKQGDMEGMREGGIRVYNKGLELNKRKKRERDKEKTKNKK